MIEQTSSQETRSAWWHVLAEQASRHPLWQLPDVYKLVYQAALGAEHAVLNVEAARQWLEKEIASLGSGPAETALEPISPDGKLVRVNLRPYLAEGGSLDALLLAFLRTAAWRGEQATLLRYLDWTSKLANAGGLTFTAEAVQAFFAGQAQAGYPPVHHSQVYREAYRPAYRVARVEFLQSNLAG